MDKVDIDDIRNAMFCDGNMICFSYNGLECGADIEGGIPAFRFHAWCGSKIKYYSNFDMMINDEIFDGRSLTSLLGTIEIFFV